MQSLETISCWVLWQCGNHFSATELQNCHFPSLSPTIDGDGGQGCRLKEKKSPEKWNLGNLCWNGANLPFLFTLPQPLRSWSSGLGRPRRASSFFGACCSTDYYGQKREIQKCSDMRNHDIWIYLNRNTFAPATIPPALKRSLANIHTHVLACADKN